jgi:Tfp pilus assembly protein PilN
MALPVGAINTLLRVWYPCAFFIFFTKKTMKQIFALIGLLLSLGATAQKSEMQQLSEKIEKSRADMKRQVAQTDSLSKSISDMMTKRYDSMQEAQIKRDAQRSGEMMLRWHNERQAKARRKMYLYFGLGFGFLGLLVFGLLRKRKSTKQ